MQKAQIDVLDAYNVVFDRAKAQALCIYLDLDLSDMDFLKIVIHGDLVHMEEAKPFPIDDPIQEDRDVVSNPEVEGEDKDDE